MVSALKGLQEKIRKLELERADAEDNLKNLAAESRHYKDVLQKELTVKESTQGVIAKQNKRKLQNNNNNVRVKQGLRRRWGLGAKAPPPLFWVD